MNHSHPRPRRLSRLALAAVTLGALALLLFVQYLAMARANREHAWRTASLLADEVQGVLELNERKAGTLVEALKENYITRARAVAYMLDRLPGTDGDAEELRHIASLMSIDEINLLDGAGVVVGGTEPLYYGLSFDSGEQMGYFKPMLADRGLAMCQDVTPNTAEGKPMMYAICWNDAGDRMVQVGIKPLRLLEELRANRPSEVVADMPSYDGVEILMADADGRVLGSSARRSQGAELSALGIDLTGLDLAAGGTFTATVDGRRCYCAARSAGDGVVVILQEARAVDRTLPSKMLTLGLYLVAAVAVIAVVVWRMTLRLLAEKRDATTDALTGLPNRRACLEALAGLADDPRRDRLVYGSLDLNGLKDANDTYGHDAGDALLTAAAQRMTACFGPLGTVYRVGGDEFAALLFCDGPQLEAAEARFAGETARWRSAQGEGMSVSCGWAAAREHPEVDLAGLARLADEQMYREKARYYETHQRDRRHHRGGIGA